MPWKEICIQVRNEHASDNSDWSTDSESRHQCLCDTNGLNGTVN